MRRSLRRSLDLSSSASGSSTGKGEATTADTSATRRSPRKPAEAHDAHTIDVNLDASFQSSTSGRSKSRSPITRRSTARANERRSTRRQSATESSSTDDSSTSKTEEDDRDLRRLKRSRGRPRKLVDNEGVFGKFLCKYRMKEDHGKSLYGCAFNQYMSESSTPIFSTVGGNRVTVYQCEESGAVTVLQSYSDPCTEEVYYCCAWMLDPASTVRSAQDVQSCLVVAAGGRGVIRCISTLQGRDTRTLVGHTGAINELAVHPVDPSLLLSASKGCGDIVLVIFLGPDGLTFRSNCFEDYSLRLWSIRIDQCLAVFGGLDGHADEVISCDFSTLGHAFVSSGCDHAVKIWHVDANQKVRDIVQLSHSLADADSGQTELSNGEHRSAAGAKNRFTVEPVRVYYPNFSTRNVHANYVDSVRWLGECIFSKACKDESVRLWRAINGKGGRSALPSPVRTHAPSHTPESVTDEAAAKLSEVPEVNTYEVLEKLEIGSNPCWFVRFAIDSEFRALALGKVKGEILIWNLRALCNGKEGAHKPTMSLWTPKCTALVRQVAFAPSARRSGRASARANILIAVCDDATVWRWDQKD